MTREELKVHCEKQIKKCERWAEYNGKEPSGTFYEEHKLILELLEQEPILDKIRAEIEQERSFQRTIDEYDIATGLRKALEIIDKYKAESEVEK